MKSNIWENLPKPFYVLAPMEDVTDTVFRRIVASVGRPDLMFTEFTSCEGMVSEHGREFVTQRLQYTPVERPLIAQVWGKSVDAYYEGVKQIREMGFEGVDINMGCPVEKIVKQGCCSALIKNPKLASEIIHAVQEAAGDMPVSVKTRIGFSKVVTEGWCGFLLEHNLAALTVHGRTAKQQSKGDADWNEVGKVVKLRDRMGVGTKIVGNGDIETLEQADQVVAEHGVDGVMIGRGIFKNPWLFNRDIEISDITPQMRLELLMKHLLMFKAHWRDKKNFNIMKKFLKTYVNGFEGASELRDELYRLGGMDEMIEAVGSIEL